MKKILCVIAAIIGIIVAVWLLSYVIGFIWELFWIVVAIAGIAYIVKKFGWNYLKVLLRWKGGDFYAVDM